MAVTQKTKKIVKSESHIIHREPGSFTSITNGKLHLYKSAGGFDGAPNNGNPERKPAHRHLVLEYDGSSKSKKGAIGYRTVKNNVEFYAHDTSGHLKKVCTISLFMWNQFMSDNVLPSEIPDLMAKVTPKKAGMRCFFHFHEGQQDIHTDHSQAGHQVEVFSDGKRHRYGSNPRKDFD